MSALLFVGIVCSQGARLSATVASARSHLRLVWYVQLWTFALRRRRSCCVTSASCPAPPTQDLYLPRRELRLYIRLQHPGSTGYNTATDLCTTIEIIAIQTHSADFISIPPLPAELSISQGRIWRGQREHLLDVTLVFCNCVCLIGIFMHTWLNNSNSIVLYVRRILVS